MPVDYDFISTNNRIKYGTDIKRIGRMLLADRYDDRTHFIFELLQNAEDALAKRGASWNGSRTVTFSLSSDELTISHSGKPFDEADVLGVCGIGESTKKLTDIGRFGIGFKSVYAFTDNPEIHSGDEHFAIQDYVHPKQVSTLCLEHEETVIRIPFRDDEPDAKDTILNGLRNLSTRTLLFLRQIEEIQWKDVDDGISGLYMRGKPEPMGSNARKVVLIGQDDENGEVEEDYIVFSREVCQQRESVGHVEIAFSLEIGDETEQPKIQPATNTELVAFFPTVLSTNLGFVMQGPYRTTPSRDNVPANNDWNRHLVEETSRLLIDALMELRKLGLLSVSVLECLPLEKPQGRFLQFLPIFDMVKEALLTECLLLAYKGGHYAAKHAKLARGQALRALISREQLTTLFKSTESLFWLSDEITADRTSKLRDYLVSTLNVDEVDPGNIIRRLDRPFLEDQPDKWMRSLYKFLNGQRSNRFWMERCPLVRLDDGTHTVAFMDEQPQAYLPTENKTDFPIVRASVCQSDDALEFLKYLGLREPDLVDDVIAHVLPEYQSENVNVSDADYQSDIERIQNAHGTDSREQRNRLTAALREAKFIAAVDAGKGFSQFLCPQDVYQSTDAHKNLFRGVNGVKLVDDSRSYLRGGNIRRILQSVGTSDQLARVSVQSTLTYQEKSELRSKSGEERYSGEYPPAEDYTLMGLDKLIDFLPNLPSDELRERAGLLWDALCIFEQRNSTSAFKGIYHWFYYYSRRALFPSRLARTLNGRAWVPDKNGVLQPPSAVIFSDTGWDENPNLQSEIHFMLDTVTELAEAMGIEPEAVNFLKQNGITLEQLKERFAEPDEDTDAQSDDENTPDPNATLESEQANTSEPGNSGTSDNEALNNSGAQPPNGNEQTAGTNSNTPDNGKQDSTAPAKREFISYVAISQNDNDEEPDGLTHQERMSLESQAIALILSEEPSLQRTPPNNRGFDLFEENSQKIRVRWVEVKSMKGSLENRPATLTRTQFEFAQEKQDAFWLYVVEKAGTPDANIIRIQNPAGKARTFTFDRGWRNVAESIE